MINASAWNFLFHNLTTGVVFQDNSGAITQVNSAAERILGLTEDQMKGKTSVDPDWRSIRENGDPFPGEEHPAMVALRTGKPVENVIMGVYQPEKKQVVWININSIPYFEKGKSEPGGVFSTFEDITEKKKTQEELIHSNRELTEKSESLEALFNSQSTYVLKTDLHGFVTYANPAYVKMFFSDKEKNGILGSYGMDSIMPYHHDRVREVVSLCITHPGESFQVEIDKPGPDGLVKNSLWDFIAMKDDKGHPIEILCTGIDVTELNKAQIKIQESESRYRSLVESSTSIIAMFDLEGVAIFVNDLASRLVGLTPEQALKKKFSLQDIFPDNRKHQVDEDIAAIVRTRKGINEEVHVELGGREFYFKSSMQPVFNEKNEVYAVLLNATDITDQKVNELKIKQSEANFRNLFFDSPQAYVIIQDGIFVDCNRASEILMESKREELIGISPDEISPEFQPNGRRSTEMAMEYIENAIRLGHIEFEWTHIRPDGKEFLAEINLMMSEYNGKPSVLVLWRDISDEKRNQKVVQQLSQIVNQSPVSIIMTDIHGHIEYINKATTNNLGYSFEDVKGLNPSIWKSGNTDLSEYEQLWETALSGKKWRGEFLNKRKDGELIYESSTVFPIFDSNQTITNLVAIQEDITERKKAEADLRLFQTVFDSAVNGRLITDLEGKIIYCNQYYADMHHTSKDEIIGSNCLEQVSDISRPQYQIIRKRLLQTGTISAVEIEHKRKDGNTFPGLVNSSVIRDEKGKDKYISITILDISDRKQIENEIIELNLKLEEKVKGRTLELQSAMNRLETFFEVSLDMLCIANQNGRFVKLSKAFEDVLHYTREDMEGQEFLKFIHPDDIQSTIEAMQTLQGQNKVFSFVNRYRTKEGDYRFIEWYASPVGEYVYAVARDITDRKERELELINARKIAEEANASKSVFLSRMSHELRTPMNSILGFAQLLEMSDMNEMQESSVRHILHSGKHLLGLINEVLDIARIETGKISLSIEQVNVTASLKEVCALMEPLSQRNAVELVLGESLSENLYVRADQQRTVQIMTNLINNAIKYNHSGGKVFIEQSLVKGSKGQEMVRITIKDTGIGIKQEDLGRLFTPFERIGAQNTEIEGTGLGLAVVKELIGVLGGELGVNSAVNEGSEFWVELPKCDSEDVHTHEEIEDELMKMENNSNTATILYIEDNAMNISLVEDIFKIKRPGYRLMTTTMGSEAVDLATEHRPRLILLDLDLPDMHGSLVLKQLKENEETKGIPVVVVSADATKVQIKNLMSSGAERYITKPFDITEFLTVVDLYIEN